MQILWKYSGSVRCIVALETQFWNFKSKLRMRWRIWLRQQRIVLKIYTTRSASRIQSLERGLNIRIYGMPYKIEEKWCLKPEMFSGFKAFDVKFKWKWRKIELAFNTFLVLRKLIFKSCWYLSTLDQRVFAKSISRRREHQPTNDRWEETRGTGE